MKKTKIFALLAMTAFIFAASCGKESVVEPSNEGASLVVKLPLNMKTRAVEDPVAGGTNSGSINLENVVVFMLNGGTVVPHPDNVTYPTNGIEFDATEIGAGEKWIELVPATVNRVVVVANIPSADLATVLASGTYSDIATHPYTLASQNLSISGPSGLGGIQDLTMMGEGIPVLQSGTNPVDSHDWKEVSIELKALTARFEIGGVIPGVGVVSGSLKIEGVWLNNFYPTAAKVSPPWTFPSAWTTTPAAGVSDDPDDFDNSIVTYTFPSFTHTYFFNIGNPLVVAPVPPGDKVYAFHVFAGNVVPHLIILVSGEYATGYYDGDDKYFLKWYTFTKFMDGATPITTVDPNIIYKVGVATGIAINASEGTDEPELTEFDLSIIVTIADWTAKPVTPVI